jgi:hypothetical protein
MSMLPLSNAILLLSERTRNPLNNAIFFGSNDAVYGIHPTIILKGFDFCVKKQLNTFLKLKENKLNIRLVFNKDRSS